MMILQFIKEKALEKKIILSFYVFVSILSWAVGLALPYVLGRFIDQLTINPNKTIIYKFTVTMAVIAVVTVISSYIANIQMTKIINEFSYTLKEKILEHLLEVKQKSVQGLNSSNVTQKIFSDSDEIIKFIIQNFLGVFTKTLTVIYVIVFMVKIDIELSYLFFLLTPVYFIVYRFFRKKVYDASFKYKEEQNNFFGMFVHKIDNLYDIKINNFKNLTLNEVKNGFQKLLYQVINFSKISFGFSSIGSIISSLFNIALVFAGGLQIINGNLTIGTFTIISNYFSTYIGSIDYLLTIGKEYQQFLVSVKRMEDILKLDTEQNGKTCITEIQEIKFENFKYGFEKDNLLIDIKKQTFQRKNIYCIMGENGAGKSTLINLICKVYDDYDGNIYINDVNIKDVDIKNMRKNNIAFLEQNIIFYSNLMEENLIYGLAKYDDDMLLKYKQEFDLYEFGQDKNLTGNGIITNLSGGERQKVGLIRTFLKSSDVVILDEPSSFLDQKSICCIKKHILELKKQNKIVILITHDKAIAAIADHILKIK